MRVEKDVEGCGEFSHVGVVVNSEILPNVRNLKPGRWYVWESTASGKLGEGIKNINGRTFLGVQVRDLEEVVLKYGEVGGDVAWASLINNPYGKNLNIPLIMEDLYNKYNNTYYDCCIPDLIASIFKNFRKVRNLYRKFMPVDLQFCSELVARVYQKLGIIDQNLDPEDVTPVDFLGYDQDGIPKLVKDPVYFTEASKGIP